MENNNNRNFKRQVILTKKEKQILVLGSGVGSCTIDSVNCVVTLSEIEFVNEMYSPAHLTIKATLVRHGQPDFQNGQDESSLPSYQNIVDFFLLAKASVQNAKSQENFESNFYVHEVRPTYVNNSNKVILYLDIFSADKLLTLDKYSKSYVHASLYADILAKQASKFTIEKEGFSVPTRDFSTRLKYSKSKDNLDMEEIKHPYLVQYNESFYDFLIRSANRTGEFLYFADGHLTLGVNAGGVATKVGKYYSLAIESRNNSVRPTTGISRKYMVGLGKDKKHEKSSSNLRYTQPTANDDYLVHYKEDEFDSVGKEYMPISKIATEAFKALVTSPTIGGFFKAILFDLPAKEAVKAAWYSSLTNSKYNKSAIEGAPGRIDNEKVVFTGTYRSDSDYIDDWYVNADADFYNKIDECEKKMGCRTITLTFDDLEEDIPNYQVGQLIEVSDSEYVVTNVHYNEIFDGHSMRYEHVIKALPLLKVKVDASTHEAELWLADEKASHTGQSISICCPTALPEEKRIRKAAAQTAWVVDSDDPKYQGRVRIRYAWDEDGVDSPWIRQAEPAAGKEGGVNFRLYKDNEVMIGYENDNIEQPYIIGALYHDEDDGIKNGVPVGRNKFIQNTHLIRNRSGHQMVISEKKNNASFFMGINPSLSLLTGGINWGLDKLNVKDPKNGSEVAGGFLFTDKYGIYNVSMSSDQRQISIASPMGNIKLSAFSGISISAPRGDISISGKNVSIKAANKLTIESGSNAKNTEFKKTSHDVGVGTAITDVAAQGIVGGFFNFLESFIDLSVLRHVAECIVPPVDGTLQIKSHRYLLLEAGKGNANIPQKGFQDALPVNEKDQGNYNKYYGGSNTAVKMMEHINLLSGMVDELRSNYIPLLERVQNAATEYNYHISIIRSVNRRRKFKDGDVAFVAIKNIIGQDEFDSSVIFDGNIDPQRAKTEIRLATTYWSAIKALDKFVRSNHIDEKEYHWWKDMELGEAFFSAKKVLHSIFADIFKVPDSINDIPNIINNYDGFDVPSKRPKWRVIYSYLTALTAKDNVAILEFKRSNEDWANIGHDVLEFNPGLPQTDKDMVEFLDGLQFYTPSGSDKEKLVGELIKDNFVKNTKKNTYIFSTISENNNWGYDRAKYGRILFSDQDDNTYYVDSGKRDIVSNPNPNIGEIRKLVKSILLDEWNEYKRLQQQQA